MLVGDENPNWLAASYSRALRSGGIDVSFWDPVRALESVARGGKIGRTASRFLHVEAWVRKANSDLLREAKVRQPSLILVTATHGLRAGSLAQVRVLCPNTIIYCVYPDSPHNLDNERIACLPFFDRLFASSPAWVDSFRRLGATRSQFLPFAADPTLHAPIHSGTLDLEFTQNVAFVGNWRPEREKFLESFLEFDLKIWGENYWRTRTRPGSPLRSRWAGRTAVGAEFAEVCARTRVMLNVMDSITWPGPNMRTFEQPACRAFSLVERTQPILEIFEEGRTIECFSTVDEAREKLRYYLNHPNNRQSIADAAYHYVINGGHTYSDRVQTLLACVAEDREKT
jgi:spore maturation protein CgeB